MSKSKIDESERKEDLEPKREKEEEEEERRIPLPRIISRDWFGERFNRSWK